MNIDQGKVSLSGKHSERHGKRQDAVGILARATREFING